MAQQLKPGALNKKSFDTSHTMPPVSRELLKSEINADTFVRMTNKGDNEVHVVNYKTAPNTLQEIGRLREVSFSASGGGTGQPLDLDDYDMKDPAYQQLIVWSPEEEEIVGGYRFIDCSNIWQMDPIPLSTQHYFHFSEKFRKEIMPETIELGRSWVQPMFQPSKDSRKGLFSLDNLWDGIGAIAVDNPHIKHFFGKITMYTNYNREARDAVLTFMHLYFPDNQRLVYPIDPLSINHDLSEFKAELKGLTFKEGMRVLNQFVKERGEIVPPLFSNYMQLSPSMKTFGTTLNNDFGTVEETGILLTIAEIYEEKRERHVNSYQK